jgi:hypothetical protein
MRVVVPEEAQVGDGVVASPCPMDCSLLLVVASATVRRIGMTETVRATLDPVALIGGMLQVPPFFVPPAAFLDELRSRDRQAPDD